MSPARGPDARSADDAEPVWWRQLFSVGALFMKLLGLLVLGFCGFMAVLAFITFLTQPPGLPDHDELPTFSGLVPLDDETSMASYEQNHSRTFRVVDGDLCSVLQSSVNVMAGRGAEELLELDVDALCTNPEPTQLWSTEINELLWRFSVEKNEPELIVKLGVSRLSSL